uniref:HD1 protein n=1 Tax=Volvariella volvacea TaxID=36659 RepID=A0A1B2U711_9AGAR|nr:HD1 protein [Volvariella volvacea]
MATLRDRLLAAEESLLQAMQENAKSLDAFELSWNAIAKEIEEGHSKGTIDEEIATLAHTIARRVCVITSSYMDYLDQCDTITASLESNLAQILEDDAIPLHPRTSSPTCQPSARSSSYTTAASSWLLDHLANPYPSTSVRQKLASTAGVPRKDVDNWFTDARGKIGWTSLRKRRFSNKRHGIVDAATRFFMAPDSNRPLSDDLCVEFIKIRTQAHALFLHKVTPTTLAAQVDPETHARTPSKVHCPYPSPAQSPDYLPASPIPPSDPESPPSLRSIDSVQETHSYVNKGLPSPSLSAASSPEASQPPSPSSDPSSSRKRRLSGSLRPESSKRCRIQHQEIPPTPQPSQPSILDDWFQCENTASWPELNSTAIDVQLYNYSSYPTDNLGEVLKFVSVDLGQSHVSGESHGSSGDILDWLTSDAYPSFTRMSYSDFLVSDVLTHVSALGQLTLDIPPNFLTPNYDYDLNLFHSDLLRLSTPDDLTTNANATPSSNPHWQSFPAETQITAPLGMALFGLSS